MAVNDHQPYQWKRSKFHGQRTNLDFAKLVKKREQREIHPDRKTK